MSSLQAFQNLVDFEPVSLGTDAPAPTYPALVGSDDGLANVDNDGIRAAFAHPSLRNLALPSNSGEVSIVRTEASLPGGVLGLFIGRVLLVSDGALAELMRRLGRDPWPVLVMASLRRFAQQSDALTMSPYLTPSETGVPSAARTDAQATHTKSETRIGDVDIKIANGSADIGQPATSVEQVDAFTISPHLEQEPASSLAPPQVHIRGEGTASGSGAARGEATVAPQQVDPASTESSAFASSSETEQDGTPSVDDLEAGETETISSSSAPSDPLPANDAAPSLARSKKQSRKQAMKKRR